MSRACLYFGVELPERRWAAALHDVDVVIQPYHPLVLDGGFAEWFPRARRYVYVNPTTVDPWLIGREAGLPPIREVDEIWHLPRVDIADPASMTWAVDKAVRAAHSDGDRCRGLFVDDLDVLDGTDPALALEFLSRVESEAPEVRWFVNRAFGLWPSVARLDAVLLEDIAPRVGRPGPADDASAWLRAVVIPSLDTARPRGVAVHALTYADQVVLDPDVLDESLEHDLEASIDSIVTGRQRDVAEWRISA